MSTTETGAAPVLPASLRVGAVELTVTDVERSAGFYEHSIGLRVHRREPGRVAMGAGGEDLLVLAEAPDALPAGRHAGLYHFALLHPSRLELARAAQRLIATHTRISGASDHGVSEAIYLPDPDGNGIELAADRGREHWGDLRDPTVVGGPLPLDVAGLLALVEGEEAPRHAGRDLVVGHVHLHVGDLEQALAFYRDLIGFEVMTALDSAAFLAAGGYHHHLGVNTWRGHGAPPVPPGTVGLRHWTIVVPADAVAALRERLGAAGVVHDERPGGSLLVRDPWEIPLLVAPEG